MAGTSSSKFAGRAFAAVALMLGFYVLSLGLVAVLLLLGWVDLQARRIHLQLLAFVAIAVFGILRGVFFLADKFEPPGPEVTRAQEPKLFDLIESVAAKMGARMPEHVYLFPGPNAFVAEVGGFMGIFGTRRVMAIGLAYMNVDTVSMLKATIAHEFGHFAGGDTRLGAFIYRTRGSIGRVIQSLGDDSWLTWPFKLYGKLFMRITQAISRQQELDADAWSVRIAGRTPHLEGLRRESVAGAAYERFLRTEVVPLLESEAMPRNLFDGLRRYIANLGEDGQVAKLEEALHAQETDPYDSHPALADRLAFAKTLPDPGVPDDDRPSRELLVDPDRVEARFTKDMLAGATEGTSVKVLEWDDVGTEVYAAKAARLAAPLDTLPGATTLGALLDALQSREAVDLVRELAPDTLEDAEEPEPVVAKRVLSMLFTSRVAVELAKLPGATWDAAPGRAVRVKLADGSLLDPADLVVPAVDDRTQVPLVKERLVALGVSL